MERPEVVDPLKEEEQLPVEKQTDEAFSARGLAEKRLGKVGTGILDFVPIAGDVLAAGDVADSYRRGDKLGTAVNLAALGVGVVPIVGDLAAKGLKKALGTYRRSSKIDNEVIDKGMEDIVDSDVVVSSTPKAGGKRFVKDQKEIDSLFDKGELSVEEWEAASKKNATNFKAETGIDVTDKYPEIKESAIRYYKEIEEGVPVEQARKRHLDVIGKVNPIREWDDVPLPTSPKQQVLSLKPNQREDGTFLDISKQEAKKLSEKLGHEVKTAKLKKNDFIRGRLDIPAYTRFNSWVTTILTSAIKGKGYGDAIHYKSGKPFTQSPDGKVRFNVSEPTAKKIVTGELDKTPFALVEGYYNPMTAKEIRSKVKKLLKDPEWTQLGFDPRRLTGFYTRNNRDQFPVGSIAKEADEVFQIGPLLLAKNVRIEEAPRLNKGGAIRTYKEGGVVPMQEQMKFAFMNEGGVLADDGVERDPVSGNEVPSGSMAKEVRDDVPAMLSEGEYVVPADVVRYHGIDKFEELRDEAKMGLSRMEQDGRIGGQPVEEQEEFPFPVEELQGFDEGGAVGDTYSDVMGSDFRANQRYGSLPTLGFELRNFTNPKTGQTVVIPFFNGQPMQYIPPDFLQGGAATTGGGTGGVSTSDEGESSAGQVGQTGLTPLAQDVVNKVLAGESTGQQTKPFSQYSPEEFDTYLKQRQSGIGKFVNNLPILGSLLTMQDEAAREFARKSLIQGKNFATGEPITNKEADILMQVADMPRGKSLLSTIESFLTGKPSIEIDNRPPIDTELRRTTYGKPTTKTQPTQEYYGPEGFQNIIKPQPTQEYYGPEGFQNIIKPQPTQEYYGPGSFQNIIEPQEVQTVDAKPSAFDMSATAQVVSQDVKEGLFYNPGNIEIGQNYAGEIGTYADGRFAQFSAPQFGVRALAVDMKTKAERYNNDVESMLLEYLGGGRSGSRTSRYKKAEIENPNARVYIRNAVNAVGNKKIDTSNVKQMKGLVEQIIKNENTKQIADFYLNQPNVIEEGIVLSQKSFPKETKLADARKTLSGELFQAGLVKQPLAMPVGLGETAVAGEASQPLTQTFVPPQAPTAEQVRLGARSATPETSVSQLPTGTEQRTTGLQDLPVGVSIEADGKFTGTGGLGAVQQFPAQLGEQESGFAGLPPVQSVDPLRADILNRLARSKQPKPATMFRGLGAEYDKAKEQANLATLQKGIQQTGQIGPPTLEQQMTGLTGTVQPSSAFGSAPTIGGLGQVTGTGGTLPQVGAPLPIQQYYGPKGFQNIIPPTRGVPDFVTQIGGATSAPTPDFVFDYGFGDAGSPVTTARADDQPDTPLLRDLKQRAQTRGVAKKSRQMNQARQDVIMGGGTAFEADAAAHAVFLDQSDEIQRNQRLNERVSPEQAAKQGGYPFRTLTDVLEQEERESSGGGGGATSDFGGGGGGSSGERKGTFCVIATHGLANGGFTKLEKAKAEIWCEKKYHGKWYGEAFRRGYRAAGNYWIKEGTVQKRYQEFKDFVAYGRGVKKGFGLAIRYYLRTIQFFVTGLFISE